MKTRKLVALFLVLAMIVACVPLQNTHVLASDDTEETLPTYNAYNEFSLENGNPNGVWGYQERTKDGTTYTDLTLDTTNNRWLSSSTSSNIKAVTSDQVTGAPAIYFQVHNQSNDAVLTFTAPETGIISIKMANGGVFAPHNSADGVRFSLTHNTTVVRSMTGLDNAYNTAGSRYFTDTQELEVQAGDKIYFTIGRDSGVDSGSYMNPEIAYTAIDEPLPTYIAYDDYSIENGNPNGVWGYETSTKDSGVYTALALDSTNGYWGNAATTGRIKTMEGSSTTVTGKDALQFYVASANIDTVLSFTAPESGTIEVSMENGAVVTAVGDATLGMRFKLLQNDTVVTQVDKITLTVRTALATTQTLQVQKGDVLRFVMGNNAAGGAAGFMNPKVAYTAYSEAEGRTYYVSQSEGSDDNYGMLESQPWQSFANLEDLQLNAGDRVLLKAGDTWSEQLILNAVAGTEESPVVIGSYGTSTEKPCIDLQLTDDTTTTTFETAVPCIKTTNAEGLELQGLKITGSGIGIDLHYDNDFNNEYIKIKDCDFLDLTGFMQKDNQNGYTGYYYVAGAICVSAYNYNIGIVDPVLIGLYVEGCTTDNCGTLITSAVSVWGLNEPGAEVLHGLYISETTMTDNDYYGTIIGADGGYMTDCVIDSCGDAESFSPGTAGIMLSAKDFAVINTEIKNQQRGGVNHDGVAIDFEKGCDNVSVENCYIHDNQGAAFLIYDSGDTEDYNKNCSIVRNVFENNAAAATGSTDAPVDPIADIRIESQYGNPLQNSVITENRYTNSRSDYQFYKTELSYFSTFDSSQIYSNTSFDSTTTPSYPEKTGFMQSASAIAAQYEALLDGYNASLNTDQIHLGKTNLIASTDNTTYKYTEGFSSTQGENGWYYLYYADGTMNQMTWSDPKWTYGSAGSLGNGSAHTNPNQPIATLVLGFKAPESGRICISMEAALQAASTVDGVWVTTLDHNLKTIGETAKITKTQSVSYEPIYIDVAEGEFIYFAISKCLSNQGDSTVIKPVIEYVSTFASLNEDEEIDICDLVRLKKNQAKTELTGDDKFNSDTNGDGVIDRKDVAILSQYLIGAIDTN